MREPSFTRAVVTGAAGFIGSKISERLLLEGTAVVGVDNLITGSRQNIQDLERYENFQFLQLDVSSGLDMVVGEVDAVLHLACPASPVDYLREPLNTMRVSSEGTRHALELSVRSGARFLLASTSEVYGEPLEHPQAETYWGNVNPIGPRSVYDEGKRFSEALSMAYYRAREANVSIARIFNTYGPHMRPDDGRVVSNLVTQALQNKDITIYGDGAQTRSFCYIDDEVDGLLALLKSQEVGPINIGNPSECSMLELANLVLRLTGSRSNIVHGPLPVDDPSRRRPDINLARKTLNWEPRTSLAEGLASTIKWYRKHPN